MFVSFFDFFCDFFSIVSRFFLKIWHDGFLKKSDSNFPVPIQKSIGFEKHKLFLQEIFIFKNFCFVQSISKHIGFLNVFDRFQEKMINLSKCITFCVFSKFSVLFNPFQNIYDFLMFLINFKRK